MKAQNDLMNAIAEEMAITNSTHVKNRLAEIVKNGKVTLGLSDADNDAEQVFNRLIDSDYPIKSKTPVSRKFESSGNTITFWIPDYEKPAPEPKPITKDQETKILTDLFNSDSYFRIALSNNNDGKAEQRMERIAWNIRNDLPLHLDVFVTEERYEAAENKVAETEQKREDLVRMIDNQQLKYEELLKNTEHWHQQADESKHAVSTLKETIKAINNATYVFMHSDKFDRVLVLLAQSFMELPDYQQIKDDARINFFKDNQNIIDREVQK